MSKYVIVCPGCGNQNIEETASGFDCGCGESFSIDQAEIVEEE